MSVVCEHESTFSATWSARCTAEIKSKRRSLGVSSWRGSCCDDSFGNGKHTAQEKQGDGTPLYPKIHPGTTLLVLNQTILRGCGHSTLTEKYNKINAQRRTTNLEETDTADHQYLNAKYELIL